MVYNPGQDLAAHDLKMTVHALAKRALWSLGFGLATLGGCIALGPPRMAQNVVDYGFALFVIRVRGLPILGVRHEDIFELAKTWTLMLRQREAWALSLYLAGGVSFTAFGLLSCLFWRRGSRSRIDQVAKGSRFLSPRRHNWQMRYRYRKKPPNEMGRKLAVGSQKLLVPESLQYLHFAFAGAAGSGKSTAIAEIIEQATQRGDKGLVVDLGGAMYAKFGRPGDHVLSLRDPRSEAWDFWHEPGISEESLAAAMIESEAGGNAYFWKGARSVLASLFRVNHTTAGLLEDFAKPTAQLRDKLREQGEMSRRIIGDGDGDQADGIIGTTVLDFAFLKELNHWAKGEQKHFSIADWMSSNNDQSWVYILVTEADLEVTKPLLRTWFDIACLAAMQRDPDDPKARQTWLILDEVKTLGRLPSLPHILDKGRKFKTSVVLGFQAISQIKSVYGEDDARSILQGLQNQFLFRMTEADSAEYVSELLGDQEVEQASLGQSYGQKSDSERGSVNRALVRKRLVMPDDVRRLETLHAFMRLARHYPVRMAFDLKQRPRVQEPARSQRRSAAQARRLGASSASPGGPPTAPPKGTSPAAEAATGEAEDIDLPFAPREPKP